MSRSLHLSERRALRILVGIATLGIVLRLYDLGFRVFYYDEAWFGYWILRFMANGSWEYRAILHGPFFVRTVPSVFTVFGVSDGSARLIVAVIGGLLPLSAWLFRTRLASVEVVALGSILAVNPLLVYYSRFLRNDVPLAAFMFVTLGLVIRAIDTGRAAYVYGAAVSLGLAFTTKESALLWLLAWMGAGLLLLDRRLLRTNTSIKRTFHSYVRRTKTTLSDWWIHGVGAIGVFLFVIVLFYAPRAGPGQPIGLWHALNGNFGMLPAVIREATIGSFHKAIDYWISGPIQDHPYLPYFTDTVRTMIAGALGVSVLAGIGFLSDRYTRNNPRDLVEFNFYVGVAAVVGYPLANNFPVPWSTIHAVVPLSIPAAVGAYVVISWGVSHVPDAESITSARAVFSVRSVYAVLAGVVLVFFVVNAGVTIIDTAYLHPHASPEGETTGSEIVYYSQAPGELREVTDAIDRAAADDDDSATDVVFVGESLAMDESLVEYPPPTSAWHERIPLPWYTEAAGATVESVEQPGEIPNPTPPVVITTEQYSTDVAEHLGDAYTEQQYRLDNRGDRSIVVFMRN